MGNKLGWIISGVILAGIGGLYLVIFVFPSRSDFEPGIRELVTSKALPAPPEEFFGKMPTEGDATEHYTAAVVLVRKLCVEMDWEDNAGVGDDLRPRIQEIYEAVRPAAKKKEFHFSKPEHVGALMTYDKDPADDISRILKALRMLAEDNVARKEYDKADEICRELTVMCWQLINEKQRLLMLQQGLMWQVAVLETMGKSIVENEKAGSNEKDAKTKPETKKRLSRLQEYMNEITGYYSWYQRKGKMVLNMKPNPGNVYYIFDNDKDRDWRTRCIARLGTLKFSGKSKRGDRKAIQGYIDEFLESSDPWEAAAAKVANELTQDQYKQLLLGG